jgi:hypothetical protein
MWTKSGEWILWGTGFLGKCRISGLLTKTFLPLFCKLCKRSIILTGILSAVPSHLLRPHSYNVSTWNRAMTRSRVGEQVGQQPDVVRRRGLKESQEEYFTVRGGCHHLVCWVGQQLQHSCIVISQPPIFHFVSCLATTYNIPTNKPAGIESLASLQSFHSSRLIPRQISSSDIPLNGPTPLPHVSCGSAP